MTTRNITAVYIRGLAFKAAQGSRRHMILNNLKQRDEKSPDLWLLKYASVAALAFCLGGWLGSVWPVTGL